jgi:(S)-2-hydroxyglutarate dehydrogenase
MKFDLVVVGGGIVGLSTARAALRSKPGARVIVVDKEAAIAGHQSGRNSNVIHAGVYYKPGSQKAKLCADGRQAMIRFCEEHDVPFRITGKIVLATERDELPRLEELQRRCQVNGVEVAMLRAEEIESVEPHAVGVAALHVKASGVTDYTAVCEAIASEIEAAGVEIRLGTAVVGGRVGSSVTVDTTAGTLEADRVVTCAGLHADRVARLISGPDGDNGLKIIPFRGEYYALAPTSRHLVRAMIYPVPDPQFPFLGVHLTRGLDGEIHTGPNAVLALAREGYSWRHRNLADLRETVAFPGFRALAKAQWRYGLDEMVRSLSRARFARSLQRLVPEVRVSDLEPAAAGVRAQAVARDGTLVDDFAFHAVGPVLHVLNAPSPAATASLEIGRAIVARLDL